MIKKKRNMNQLVLIVSICVSILIFTVCVDVTHSVPEVNTEQIKRIQPLKSSNITQYPPIRLEDTKIIEQPRVKIKPTISITPTNAEEAPIKTDLTCTIRAYHNQQRTQPIQGGIWHMHPGNYNPPLPYPWYIYYDVEVKNIGWKNADNFNILIKFINPTKPPQTFSKTASLSPGEAEIFPFRWGYFLPNMVSLYNRSVTLSAVVDAPRTKIDEISETNNNCSLTVKFVYP